MRRFLKIAGLCVAVLLAAGALALTILLDRAASAPELKPRIEQAASDFLGRPMTIGALEWRRAGSVLIGTDVRLYDDAERKVLLVEAPAVEAHLALVSPFKLAAGVTSLRFAGPRVFLRRNARGLWNAQKLVDQISARPDDPSRSWGTLAFNWFEIDGGTLTIEDAAGPLARISPLAVSGSGKLRFGRRRMHFPFDLDASFGPAPTALKLSGDLGSHLKLKLEARGGRAELLGLAWPAAAKWTGRWDGEAEYDERLPSPWKFDVRAAPLAVSSLTALETVSLSGVYASTSSLRVSASVRSATTDLKAAAETTRGGLTLDLKSAKADGAEIAGWLRALPLASTAPASARTGKRDAGPPFTAVLDVGELRYGRAALSEVRAKLHRSTGPCVLDALTFRSLGGAFSAHGEYDPAASADGVTFDWSASSVSARDLFLLAGSSRVIAGVIDTEGRLTTGTGPRFLPGMNGEFSFEVRKVVLGDAPVLLKILSRLNVISLLSRTGPPLAFDEVHGAVKIAGGKATVDRPIVLENKTLQIGMTGAYDLAARTIDAKVVVNFLTVTDEIIHMIPIVRTILLGKEKGMMPVWLEVKGTVDDPDVRIQSFRTVTAPVWNAFRRILKLPVKILDQLTPPATGHARSTGR
jgi:hypothetical protein